MNPIDDVRALFVGEIVQLNPENTKNEMFQDCLMVVTEVKSWGVQGYVPAPGQAGLAYYRAEHGTFDRTGGAAPWVVEDK